MSSTYRILCLSHDPAIVATDDEYPSPEAVEAALAAGLDSHPGCDLLIGRYSYPLVEVGCPPTTRERPGQHACLTHSVTVWVDVAWLWVLAAVYQAKGAQTFESGHAIRHWPWERLRRLREELGIDSEDGDRG
jgi:hypothetical protein